MNISIVTPVRNARDALPRCCASVASQGSALAGHIVVDGESTDGTVEWLRRTAPERELRNPRSEIRDPRSEGGGQRSGSREPGDPYSFRFQVSSLSPSPSSLIPPPPSLPLRWLSEPDRGMYDALNKGFDLTHGGILGWLNADEQYLPGALTWVSDWFLGHPDADLLFGDHLLVNADATLLARRRIAPVRWPYVLASHLYGLSCAMFFRRRIWDSGVRFDPTFRSVGDADWVARALRSGFRAGTTSRPLASFTVGTGNLSAQPVSRVEEHRLLSEAPAWVRRARVILNAARRAEMAARGACRRTPHIEYEMFVGAANPVLRHFEARDADWRWPGA